MLSLINDILDLSKIEANKMELNPGSVSIRHLFDEMGAIFGIASAIKALITRSVLMKRFRMPCSSMKLDCDKC